MAQKDYHKGGKIIRVSELALKELDKRKGQLSYNQVILNLVCSINIPLYPDDVSKWKQNRKSQ